MNNQQNPQAWEEEFDKMHTQLWDVSSWPIIGGTYKDFIRTIRQKDKERLMVGMEKLWNKNTPLTQRTLPDGRIEYKQSGLFNVTEASLEDFKQLLNQIYEN